MSATHNLRLASAHFLFVGNRLSVLESMVDMCQNLTICLQRGSYASKQFQSKLDELHKRDIIYHEFGGKAELLRILNLSHFDILVSNGCPYILPISQLKKEGQIFINCHPSLLPNLKGAHPINGAILFNQSSGATCHIMTDEVDSGAIISSIPIHNDDDISLPLLYQMCFLAEKEAFARAFERGFEPLDSEKLSLLESHVVVPYYTRDIGDMEIDFVSHSTDEIVRKVKAFSSLSQMARLKIAPDIYISEARLLQNTFLESQFSESKFNEIVLVYENRLLCKRSEGFLELVSTTRLQESLKSLLNDHHNKINKSKSPHCVFNTQGYANAMKTLSADSRLFEFTYTQEDRIFSNTAIIESIPNTPYFDMSSPYGYGGYYTNSNDVGFLQAALKAQEIEARKQNIIAEFIRFHPHYPHTSHFQNLLDFYDDNKEIIEVSSDFEKRWQGYSSRLRGKLRKSLKALQVQESKDIESFASLYAHTMQRNSADSFYFFPVAYFKLLLNMNECIMLEAKYNDQIVAMGIFLFDSMCGYYHLGANAPISLANNLNAMGVLFEHFFNIAHQRGVKSCILGGGRGNDRQDSLFAFKNQFSNTTSKFSIGGKIYNHEVYSALKTTSSSPYFLAYRYATGGGGGK